MSKLLPHSNEGERTIISDLIWDKEMRAIGLSSLKEEYFYDPLHQKIFFLVKEITDEGLQEVSLTTIQQANIGLKLNLPIVDIIEISNRSRFYSPNKDHFINQVDELIKNWKLRVAIVNLENLAKQTLENRDIDELSKDIEKLSIAIESSGIDESPTTIKEIATDAAQRIIDAHDPDKETKLGIRTGFDLYDECTKGLKEQEMIIVAARPAVGKTTLAINIANNIWEREEKCKILIFSLEMSSEQLMDRLISLKSNIPMHRLHSRVFPSELEKLRESIRFFKKQNAIIEDKAGIDMHWIRNKIRYHSMGGKVDLVIIDYLQLINSTTRTNREQQVSEISKLIKQSAKQFEIPIVVVAQLNRETENRKDGTPKLSDLRESGQLEADADSVILLWRPDMNTNEQSGDTRPMIKAALAKNRHGPEGAFDLNSNLECFQFTQA